MSKLVMPEEIEFYSPDEVAETINGITKETYRELWTLLSETPKKHQVALGGDGSDGTAETPGDTFTGEEWRMPDYWKKLSEAAQQNIIEAVAKDKA